jgi:hypothetical protein
MVMLMDSTHIYLQRHLNHLHSDVGSETIVSGDPKEELNHVQTPEVPSLEASSLTME